MLADKMTILGVLYKVLFLFSTYDAALISDPSWSAVAAHPAWKVLDKNDCGYSVADRIIGGTNAALGQFPWIARLGYVSPEESTTEWLCGGTLITPSVVVTAAHCSRNSDYQLKLVRLGEYDVRTDPDCQLDVCAPPVQDRNVSKIDINPGFLATGFHNDIALLELATPVVLNDYVSPICLPRKNVDVDLRFGEPLTVAGWGTTNLTTQERANILQVVQVPLVTPETCDTFGKSFKISAGELCAGAVTNRDACGGDSGGPLMKVYDTPDGPKVYLVGVVSFGPTVCGIKKPGVYTSTSHYIKYILDGVK